MSNYIYSSIKTAYVFDDQFNIVEAVEYPEKELLKTNKELSENRLTEIEQNMLKKHPNAVFLAKKEGSFKSEPKKLFYALEKLFDSKEYLKTKEQLMDITVEKLRVSVTYESFLIQSINNIDEIDKCANMLTKRLREWYEYYAPEVSIKIEDHETFVNLILEKNREQLLKEINEEKTIGSELSEHDLMQIKKLAEKIKMLYELRKEHETYIEKIMKENYPNINAVAGSTIGARLLAIAGSLKRLVGFPSSTVQLLGAEKALFRHIKTGARPPKYGVIVNHSVVANAPQKDKGKAARALADKISIASKIDYFKGNFYGDELRKQLEEKLKKQN
jgi:nucleolar protein 56